MATSLLSPQFRRAIATGLALCLLAALRVSGQSYKLEPFSEEQGLLDKYIYTINQDQRGFLWVGTGSGLFRFDGAEFERYSADSTGLAEDFVTSSFRDEDGVIWLGHFAGGLTRIEDQVPTTALTEEILGSRIIGIGQDKTGNIWVASQRNGMVRVAPDGTHKHFPDAVAGSIVMAVHVTEDGHMLVGTDEGLKVLNIMDGVLSYSHDVDSIPLTAVQVITPHYRRPGYWIGTQDEGLLEYIPGRNPIGDRVNRIGEGNAIDLGSIKSISEDAEENVWVGTQNSGLVRFNDKDISNRLRLVTPTPESDTVGNCQVECLFVDRFGQLWMGIYNQGLVCMAEETFTRYQLRSADNTVEEAFTTLEDHEGNLWIGTDEGLFMVDQLRLFDNDMQYSVEKPLILPHRYHFTTEDGLPSNEVTAIFEDAANEIWIGTRRDGVCRLNAERTQIDTLVLSSISLSKAINAITADNQGNVWIATNDGAFLIPPDTAASIQYFSTRNGLAHNNIYDIFPDSKGRVWIATHTNNVTIFDGQNFESITVSVDDEVSNVNCISEDEKGNIWLGTDGMGLYRYDGESFTSFTENQGMLANYCYEVAMDGSNHIWIAHRNGVSRYIPETDVFTRFSNKAYFDFEENPIRDIGTDARGQVWFASPRGFIRFNWQPNRSKLAEPYTFIQRMRVGGKLQAMTDDLQLPYDVGRVEFKFVGLTFVQQANVRYQYKLEGRDLEWSDPSTQNTASYQGIREGEYTFMVRACNTTGICNEQPATFTFSVSLPFWQTWWFRILVLLFLGGLVFLYVRYRVYRLNRQKQELETQVMERTEEIRLKNLELEKLSLVASETDNAVFILDAKGNLEYINPGFTRLTGLTFEDVIEMRKGRNFLDTSSNSEIRELLKQVMETNSSAQYESQLPSRDGKPVWVISTLTPILDDEGNLARIVIIDSNISEQKLAEDKIRQMNSELERLVAERTRELKVANEQLQVENEEHVKTAERLRVINQELDNFVYRASHDLKGPLASILGLVDIATTDLSHDEDARKYLGMIDKAARRLDLILVDLIEATQVKQGALEFSRFRPRQLAEEILESLANKKEYATHEFRLEIDEQLEIVSDKRLLSSIVQNFIDNSVKYRDEEKPQAITWISLNMVQGGMIEIRVRDNGIGIKEELKARVFDMFFRGTNQAGGSGLGLYIVKQAAEKLKGTIDMESEYKVGTTFMAYIPNRTDADIEE